MFSCSTINKKANQSPFTFNQNIFLAFDKNTYKSEKLKDELEINESIYLNEEEAQGEIFKKRQYVQKFYEKQLNPYMKSIEFENCQHGLDLDGKLIELNNLKHFFFKVVLDKNYKITPCLSNEPASFARFDYYQFKNKIVIFKYKTKIQKHILDLNPDEQYMNYLKNMEY
jgi:hypothetical protein